MDDILIILAYVRCNNMAAAAINFSSSSVAGCVCVFFVEDFLDVLLTLLIMLQIHNFVGIFQRISII